MEPLYVNALERMSSFFNELSALVQPPKKVQIGDQYAFRYECQSIQAAMLQKLARVLTGVQAIHMLNACGLTQEQAAMQRMHDEFTEDISFLALSIILDQHTELHDEYLKAFYEEEFDNPSSSLRSSQKRPMILRKKIRGYISNNCGLDDPSTSREAGRTIHKGYSGYVHGASPHIMELYYGTPPKFHLHGAKSSPLYRVHVDDLPNYYYRGIVSFALSAKAFDSDITDEVLRYSKVFAEEAEIEFIA